jgi:hypothetical protein
MAKSYLKLGGLNKVEPNAIHPFPSAQSFTISATGQSKLPMRINHLAIYVKDIKQSRVFYTQVLGLDSIPELLSRWPALVAQYGWRRIHTRYWWRA